MKGHTWFYLRAAVLGVGLGFGAVAYRVGFQGLAAALVVLGVVLYLCLVKNEHHKSEDR